MPEIVFSQKVSDLLVKHNLMTMRARTRRGFPGLTVLFKIRGWGSVFIGEEQESIDEYKGSQVTKDHCIFMIPHPTNQYKYLIYFSELSEKELLRLISLRAFW